MPVLTLPEIHLGTEGVIIVQAQHHPRLRHLPHLRQHPCGKPFKRMEMHHIIGAGLLQEPGNSGLGRGIAQLRSSRETGMGRRKTGGIDDLIMPRAPLSPTRSRATQIMR